MHNVAVATDDGDDDHVSMNEQILDCFIPHRFCGNRKPRQIYSSSTGKLSLTFKSEGAALPAIFDCTVLCSSSDESPTSGRFFFIENHRKYLSIYFTTLIYSTHHADQKRPTTSPAPTDFEVEELSSSSPVPPTQYTSPIVVHFGSSATAQVVSSNKGNTTLIINLPSKPQLRIGNCSKFLSS